MVSSLDIVEAMLGAGPALRGVEAGRALTQVFAPAGDQDAGPGSPLAVPAIRPRVVVHVHLHAGNDRPDADPAGERS